MSVAPATYLGFDFGTKRIGVAVGQTLTATATALVTLGTRNDKPDWEAIGALIAQWQPAALVVGLPLNMDGSENELTRRSLRFCRQLRERYHLEVHTMDERLSSVAATEQLARSGRHGGRVDHVAAQIILENWLNQRGTG